MAHSEDDIIIVTLQRGEKDGLGFNIRGGYDMPYIPEDPGIFVSKIRPNGAAAQDGRLSEGDKLLALNGQSLENIAHQAAVTLFQKSGQSVELRVQKDAASQIKATIYKQVNPAKTKKQEAIFMSVGAAILVTLVLWNRKGIKNFFSHMWTSGFSRQSIPLIR